MARKIVGYLVGQISCPICYAVSEWDNPNDIQKSIDSEDSEDKEYIICKNCNNPIYLNPSIDYLSIRWKTNEEQDTETSNLVNFAAVNKAIL